MYITFLMCLYAIFSCTFATCDEILNLDLDTAIQRAWSCSPTLAIANTEVDVKQSEAYQVSLWPNPIASIEADDAGFIASRGRRDDTEVALSISQLFELGGKRSARQREAALQMCLAVWSREAIKIDIAQNVKNAVVDVAAAQEYLRVAIEQHDTAQEVFNAVSSKVEMGKVSPLQAKKSEITHITAKLTLEKAQRALELAKKKLAATWGSNCVDFDTVNFALFDIEPLPSLESLEVDQYNNPDIARFDAEILAAQEVIALEEAQSVPDLTVTGGYIAGSDPGWLVGVSMPIPIFDRNQGNICKAKQLLYQLYDQQQESLIQLNLEMTTTYDALVTAYNQSLAFQRTLLASAISAFDAAHEGYTQGKNEYIELLDAQRTLFDVQQQYIDTVVEYHYKKEALNRLIGKG